MDIEAAHYLEALGYITPTRRPVEDYWKITGRLILDILCEIDLTNI